MKELKGNAIVGQSGGPTAAINATLAGVINGVSKAHSDGTIDKLFGMNYGIEGMMTMPLIDLNRYFDDEEAIELLANTPASALGSCRKKLPVDINDEMYDDIFDFFKSNNIKYFFYIGGNDSMDTVSKLTMANSRIGYDIRLIGVPKTIDNDLVVTDHTPGFGSAAKYIATVMSEIICDCAVYTKKAVTIVEIMGRDAGWLTAAAALAGTHGKKPDLIYLPEAVFDADRFISELHSILGDHPDVVVAVSEGIKFADGSYVSESNQSGAVDVFGHKYLSGTAKVLEQMVRDRIGCKVRSVELNLPQRCAGHILSDTDIAESLEIGAQAVKFALSGVSGHMVAYDRLTGDSYSVEYFTSDVNEIANKIKQVPASMINSAGNGVTEECINYIRPLIVGERSIIYKDGVPVHFHF